MSYAETSACTPGSCCLRGSEGGLSLGNCCETRERRSDHGRASRSGVSLSGCVCVHRRGMGYAILAGTNACPPDSWSRIAPRVLENVSPRVLGSGRHAVVGGWVLGVGCRCCVGG